MEKKQRAKKNRPRASPRARASATLADKLPTNPLSPIKNLEESNGQGADTSRHKSSSLPTTIQNLTSHDNKTEKEPKAQSKRTDSAYERTLNSSWEVNLLCNLLEEGKTWKALEMNLISPGTKAKLEKNMRRPEQGTFAL